MLGGANFLHVENYMVSLTISRFISCSSLIMKIMSNRDKMVGMKLIFSCPFKSSHRPKTLFAAAKTEHREFNVVVMPA